MTTSRADLPAPVVATMLGYNLYYALTSRRPLIAISSFQVQPLPPRGAHSGTQATTVSAPGSQCTVTGRVSCGSPSA